MSTVQKLHIQGIRSFDPDGGPGSFIEFYTPMTLIVGQNGCGKTTIIESLKYALTAEYPPGTSKGQTFVNDPKLSTGFEVLARVQLVVLTGTGDKVTVSRRLKAITKGKLGNISVTTIEGTIDRKNADGTKAQLSSKCCDIKGEMCRIMGVAEPILNNVLFCHQEDSCWPLDEGKKVKEKFDAIFNTTMYMKCLDQLTKKEKEIATKIKIESEGLKYATEIKTLAAQKRRDLESKNIQLHKANDDKTEFETKLGDLEKKLKELEDLEREYTKIASKVQEKKGNIDSISKQMDELRESIKEHFEGDIESLRTILRNFKTQSSQKQQALKTKERELAGLNSELDRLTEMKNSFLLKQGQFQQEETLNKKRLETAKVQTGKVISMIKRLRETSQDATFSSAMEYLVNVDEIESESLQLDSAIKALAGAIHMKETEYSKVQSDFEIKEKSFQKVIDELRDKKVSLETEIQMKEKQMQDNKISITSLKKRLDDIEGCNERLALLDDEESAFAEQIRAIESSGVIEKCDSEMETLNSEIKDFERKISTLNAEIKLLTEDKSKLDQITIYNRQKQEKQNACKIILRKRGDELSAVLGGEVPEEGISGQLDKKLKHLKSEISQNEKELKTKERKCFGLEADLKRMKESLTNKEKLIEDIKMEQIDLLEGGNLDEMLDDVSEQIEARQKDNYYAEAAQFLYKKNIQKLKNKSCCPLCKRNMEGKDQVAKLIKEIERDVEKMVEKQPQDEKAIEDLKEKQRTLQEQKPRWDLKKTLDTEIPELKAKTIELEPQVQQIKDEIEDINDTLTLLKNDQATGSNCTNDVAIYEQNLKEMKKQDDLINNVERGRNAKAKAISFSLSDGHNKLKDMEGTLKAKKVEKESKDDLRNQKRKELADYQQQKNKVQAEKLNITQEMQNREALEKQKKDLEEKNRQFQDFISENNRKLPSARTEIKKAENNKTAVTKEKEEKLKTVNSDQEGLANQKKDLMKLNSEILEFEKTKTRFSEVKRKGEECNEKLDEDERKKKELTAQMDTLKDEVSSRETKQRDFVDNLTLKEKQIQLDKFKSEMEAQEKLLAETSNQGVSAKKREYSREHSKLSADLNKLLGRRQEIQKSVVDLRKELADRPYLTADEDYKTKLVTKVVYEKAKKDVMRYKAALDHAILTFHSKRMEQINKKLRELWRDIYKGNDIEYIQIKTENSDADGPSVKVDLGKSTRRTYHYRVIQMRRGIELDLRGRCSAGQKVLASLIIRIALAESFSSKCGIITLDEPTTNLDQKNINSLAETLSNLAIKMTKVKTFQLIVITHDQDFINRLLAVDPVEHYYKITRNDRGFSNIGRQNKNRNT